MGTTVTYPHIDAPEGEPPRLAGLPRIRASAITEQLRQRDVDVLTATEDDAATLTDSELLSRASALGRVVLAESWQDRGRRFAGLVFGGTIGQYVRDLELIGKGGRAPTADDLGSGVVV